MKGEKLAGKGLNRLTYAEYRHIIEKYCSTMKTKRTDWSYEK